jgi:hypothetical protein
MDLADLELIRTLDLLPGDEALYDNLGAFYMNSGRVDTRHTVFE